MSVSHDRVPSYTPIPRVSHWSNRRIFTTYGSLEGPFIPPWRVTGSNESGLVGVDEIPEEAEEVEEVVGFRIGKCGDGGGLGRQGDEDGGVHSGERVEDERATV